MAQRQNNLFAAEDWKVAYKAYSQVNYQAYDFDTMRGAMVDYVKTNFPENFNDYIESSEFIAIIELLAYLSQSLAFRMDINSRENFLETAERRDSVFKIARMLGYNPKRNIPASGLMKVTSIRTTEPLLDSQGNNLSNKTIYWDDANSADTYEQFISIMNSAMSTTNRFTSPLKSGKVGDIPTELYQINTPLNSPLVYNFDLTINGTQRVFNVANPDFNDNKNFYERHPDPTNLFNMIYRNDGKGLNSIDTGFFVMFKQGVLEFEDFNFTTPIQNRLQEVSKTNINETDVYLQEIATTGQVLNKWTKIPNTVGQTLNYNSQQLSTRNLYSVENVDTSGIRLRFPDGNFGNVPSGVYRLWHRTSDPVRYTIQPEDARNISITIPYVNNKGKQFALNVTFALQYSVSNSFPAESISAIKERASQVFYTQNRMVSAQDYNVFPASQSNNVKKIKAINKTHAGHSRYIDINDPTGTYHNVDTFADDAYLYVNDSRTTDTVVVNSVTPALEIVSSTIPAKLKELQVNNFVYYDMRNAWTNSSRGGSVNNFKYGEQDKIVWNPLPLSRTSKTGYISEMITTGQRNVLVNTHPKTKVFKENTFIKFVDPSATTNYKWVRIVNIENNGALSAGLSTTVGPIALSEEVPGLWEARELIVSMRKLFTQAEATAVQNAITAEQTFGIGYNIITDSWYIIPNSELSVSSKTGKFSIDTNSAGPNSWVILMEYSAVDVASYKYTMTVRGMDYIVQSANDLKFYNVKNVKTLGSDNKSNKDSIIFTRTNTKPGTSETFEWVGNKWKNSELGLEIEPVGLTINLPLRTRDTKATDVTTTWTSNFGIFDPAGANLAGHVSNNRYVDDAIITLNTYHQVGGITSETNVVIANNIGTVQSFPSKIVIPFSNTTFGKNIVDSSEAVPFVSYRQVPNEGNVGDEVVFKALANITYSNGTQTGTDSTGALSYGTDGASLDSSTVGRLVLKDFDTVTETGNLEYQRVQNGDYHFSKDGSSKPVASDKFSIYYENSQEKLEQSIKWDIVDTYRESDGYTDPRKVKVTPMDTDGDLVPDRPTQFAEYVDESDLVFFEYYTDFDGYRYDRPFSGVIRDFRREDALDVDDAKNIVSPTSYRNNFSLSATQWVVVKNKTVAEQFENKVNTKGLIIYVVDEDKTYQLTPLSTSLSTVELVETTDYFVRNGRGKTQNTESTVQDAGTIRWNHVAPNDVRIDPSISNIVEMVVLTSSYYTSVQEWQARPTVEFPLEPTPNELALEFSELNEYKAASDSLVFRSGKFKLLFGTQAAEEHKARFKVVKLSDNISDNELKSKIITAINNYFDVSNWEYGENFYFTELSSYIHQTLGSSIGSIVILPKNTTGRFGEMFQVKAEPNELFLSTASVNDIEIVSRLDNQSLK